MDRFRLGLKALLLAAIVATPSSGWCLARWPDANTALPGNLANNVVTVVGNQGAGTGTIIGKHDSGNGTWLCLLTADHVLRNQQLNYTIGFNNGQTYAYASPNLTVTWFMFLGPVIGGGQVDLAIMSLFVPDKSLLPTLATVAIGGAAAGDNLVLAGYGDTNITVVTGGENPPGPARSYRVDSSFGTFRTGTDAAANVNNPYTRGIYSFNALQGFLTFNPAAPNWPPASGDGYVLSGDSGGPTFKAGTLVGVHSGSQSSTVAGVEYVSEGDRWTDVDLGVAAHAKWVNDLCAVVPEPSSVIVLLMGGGSILLRAALPRRRSEAD